MSEKKISELISAENINSTDILPIVQDNNTKKVPVGKIFEKVENGYIGDVYDPTQTYAVGDYCIYNNTLYRCNTAIATAEAWNSAHWTATSIASELENRLEFEIVDSW